MKYLERVIETIRNIQVGDNLDNLQATTALAELGWDSLDLSEVVMELEEEFNISIPDDTFGKVETVGDLANLVESLKGGE